jgi:hypothetical protein
MGFGTIVGAEGSGATAMPEGWAVTDERVYRYVAASPLIATALLAIQNGCPGHRVRYRWGTNG